MMRFLGHQRHDTRFTVYKVLKETYRLTEKLIVFFCSKKYQFISLSLPLSLPAHCLFPKGSLHSFHEMNKMYLITENQQEYVSDKKLSVSYHKVRDWKKDFVS